jgi:ABC-type antimicrobial peptide transport system permease subunit
MITLSRLTIRNIRYYARSLILAIAAIAVATAAITGSLIVGTSERDSLKQNALSRIGGATHAISSVSPFQAGLAGKIKKLSPDIRLKEAREATRTA